MTTRDSSVTANSTVPYRCRPRLVLAALATSVLLLGAAGCAGSDPEPAPTSAAPATSEAPPSTPTPSVPVTAADDPSWTANQVAAVRAVDAYNDFLSAFLEDPENVDSSPILQLATEPQLTTDLNNMTTLISNQRRITGGLIPIQRSVGPEQIVDGKTEIVVVQCDEDGPGAVVVENGATQPVAGEPRGRYSYTVQWNPDTATWLVALIDRIQGGC